MNELDRLTKCGKLPLAFSNLRGIKAKEQESVFLNRETVFHPYEQYVLCEADSSCINSKIYDVF